MDMLKVLQGNHGFNFPQMWVDFAQKNNFQPVKATWIRACPDCGADQGTVLGQQVYYSTLMRLRECSCGLIWADADIDSKVISDHFEVAYKDEAYFARRGQIFDQLARLISKNTPQGGSVIDIGGGMGHLMDTTRSLRADLDVSVSDVSRESVDYCRKHFGIKSSVSTLEGQHGRYSTAVLSDVLYYVRDMRAAWDVLSNIADTLIIRGPNKLEWIRAAQKNWKHDPMQSHVKHFQQEHKFILSREYLEQRLDSLGFDVETIPTPALPPDRLPADVARMASAAAHASAIALHKLTGKIASPSMVTIARKR